MAHKRHRHDEAGSCCHTRVDVCEPSICSSVPRGIAVNAAILDEPTSNAPSPMTSSDIGLKAVCVVPPSSGQLGNSHGMPTKCCFLLLQVCYHKNAHCCKSDDRFLLLLCCPQALVFHDICSVALTALGRLLLSGDVELNPGPTVKTRPSKTSKGTRVPSGQSRSSDETHDSLLSKISEVFQQNLAIQCPRIERLHRFGRARENHPRPVIMKVLDFNDKLALFRSSFKLKDSGLRLTEDFSPRVRDVRKKLWEASCVHRNNGSSVKLRFDHLFIDNIRYNWCDASSSLVKVSNARHFPEATAPAHSSTD